MEHRVVKEVHRQDCFALRFSLKLGHSRLLVSVLDCFINGTTKSERNETIQFATLSLTFYACIANVSQVRLLLPFVCKVCIRCCHKSVSV